MNDDFAREYTFTQFERMAQKYPDRVAIIYLGERFSYARLTDLIDRFATGLTHLGVNKNDRVMVYVPNSIQWVVAFFGVQKMGATAVPVSPNYTSHELGYTINDSGSETILCLDTHFCYIQGILSKTCIKRVIVTNLVDLLPCWKKVVGYLLDKVPRGRIKRTKDVVFFRDLIQQPPQNLPVEIDPRKDLSYIFYTGGTTGVPKGVPGNHTGMTSYTRNIMGDVVGGYNREGKDTYIAVDSLSHFMALGLFVAIGLNYGNTTVVMPVVQVDAILWAIQKYNVRWFFGTPTLYRMVLENDRLNQYNLSSLTYCFCGGDVLPAEVSKRWKEHFGVSVYQVYGSTEVGHVTYNRLNKEPGPMSVGLPLKSRQCKIVIPETLEPVPTGEMGELLVTSKDILKNYWEKPEETLRSYVEMDGKIYYRTGDYVRQDEEGEIYYIERSADMIISKGYRVSASEIEAVLQEHPRVIGSCVVGVRDAPLVGERIKAVVVLQEDARGVDASELIRWCKERLAPYKVPQYIEFRDMLPRSRNGKLLRREIREEEQRKISGKKR